MRLEVIHGRLKDAFPPEQASVLAELIHQAYTDLVKTSDFNELKEIVRDLGTKMGELAEAQKRTEARVEELAEAQKETQKEVGRLDRALQELAEAQKRTEARVEELAEAQERTEEALQKLIGEHAETRRQLGGLSATVGYRLEDEAFKGLPALLRRDHGLTVKERLTRKFVRDNRGEYIEVNIVGQGERDGQTYTIVGESKSQLSKKDVDTFVRKKLKRLEGVFPEIFPVLVTYMIAQPDVEDYARQKGIAVYYSFDL